MKRDRSRRDDSYEGGRFSNDADGHDCNFSEEVLSSLLTCQKGSYSTFSIPECSTQHCHITRRRTLYRILHNMLPNTRRDSTREHDPQEIEWVMEQNNYLTTRTWRVIIFLSIVIAMIAYVHDKLITTKYTSFMPAEWQWEHNVYIARDTAESVAHKDVSVSLIAQIVPGTAFGLLEEISSRPNRAYARQWGLDFARYNTEHSSYHPRACFEKVAALNAILDRENNSTGDLITIWPHYPRVQYEFILLLAPDSILTELDTDIIKNILPQDKLVAIAGWNHPHKLLSNTDVIVFNLKHHHAKAVARLWLEMVSPRHVTCGASNDLGMLVDAIANVMDDFEDLDDLIEPLSESQDGFIGNGVIKSIPSSVPGPRTALLSNSMEQSAAILQQTADSVCYRFYPKCEVLSQM